MDTSGPNHASLPGSAPCCQDPRQESSAVVPHTGICAGGRPRGRSLPRQRWVQTGPPQHTKTRPPRWHSPRIRARCVTCTTRFSASAGLRLEIVDRHGAGPQIARTVNGGSVRQYCDGRRPRARCPRPRQPERGTAAFEGRARADDPTGTSSSAMTGQRVGEPCPPLESPDGPRQLLDPQASPHPRARATADPLGGTAIMIVAFAHPMRVDARPDPYPSRWLWLVKWHLAIPHFNRAGADTSEDCTRVTG
jgi:hypothetical protein